MSKFNFSKKELIALTLFGIIGIVIFASKSGGIGDGVKDEWGVFGNKNYGYSFEYPVNILSPREYENGDVGFSGEDSYEKISIVANSKDYLSLDEWFADILSRNKSVEWPKITLEKEIKIDGYDAWVTYLNFKNIPPLESEDRGVAFIKDGQLFEIHIQHLPYSYRDRILNSFKFE